VPDELLRRGVWSVSVEDAPYRKQMRAGRFDYSAIGCYFVTICTAGKRHVFWENGSGTAQTNNYRTTNNLPATVGATIGRPSGLHTLSKCGIIADTAITAIPRHYPNVKIDNYVVMPNHVHILMSLTELPTNARSPDGRPMTAPTTVSNIINQYKGYVSKQIGKSVWQKSFHDHIIRDDRDYAARWQYIDDNPATWESDEFYI
jgi:REP element-mobilizing transposase RayT